MAIYRPTELRDFLTSLGRSPKKSLSQNFLIDGNIIRKIVKTASIVPGDKVLEIGSGPGSLTEALLEAGATVIAVERDEVLAKSLERLGESNKRLHVCSDDIIDFLDTGKIEHYLSHGEKVKVVANLPYHLTTPIVARLITMTERCISLTIMVQDEVAKRFSAVPKTKDYGSLTIFLEFYSYCKYAFKVGRRCFYPAPKVDSAIVHLELHPPIEVSNPNGFFTMTQTAFRQRRKMLRGSLQELWPSEEIIKALEKIGLTSQARPEELSLEQFVRLFEVLPNI
jgi:16S rRNA (adenine1518-N6/adenine1519-N6)-dimethyltransferase